MTKKDDSVFEYSNRIPETISIAVKQVFGKKVMKAADFVQLMQVQERPMV